MLLFKKNNFKTNFKYLNNFNNKKIKLHIISLNNIIKFKKDLLYDKFINIIKFLLNFQL
jgi:hypothetical protein